MTWKEHYRDKIRTADEAVQVIKSGDFVRFAEALPAQTCLTLNEALIKRAPELENVTIDTTLTRVSDQGLLNPGTEKSWKTTTSFSGTLERKRMTQKDEQTNFIPQWPSMTHLCSDPTRYEHKKAIWDSDVCMVMVSPPDKRGFVTFGHSIWHMKKQVENAKYVIGEVNESMPVIPGGDNWMPVEAFDCFVETTVFPDAVKLSRLQPTPPDEQESSEVCCALIAELINDGDTIMFGGGAIPMRISPFLEHKHDLGCHTEVIVPIDLMKKGVINNKRRNLCPGKTSCTGVSAVSKEDREFIDGSPLFDMREVSLNNNPRYVCQNDNYVALNAPLQINLFGEISLERLGYRYLGGTGGQVELLLSALMSKGGRSIHGVVSRKRIPSGEFVSSIVPRFEYPTTVSIPRALADIIVTEYGVARLMGKTERERANELIAIAHPDFRAELRKEAQKLFYP